MAPNPIEVQSILRGPRITDCILPIKATFCVASGIVYIKQVCADISFVAWQAYPLLGNIYIEGVLGYSRTPLA